MKKARDDKKTKTELISDLKILRSRVSGLERLKTKQKSIEEIWKRYEFIVNTSRDFLSLVDIDYRYVAVNDAYCRAHDKRREEIVDSLVSDMWGEAVFSKIIKGHLDRCFAGDEVRYKGRFRFASVGVRNMDISYYPYFGEKGKVTHAVVVSRDVTEQKKAEKELLALKKAVETMQIGVTITDTEGRILYTNPAEAHMHGFSVKELSNKEVRILAPSGLWKNRTIESMKEIKSWRRESVNVRKDGSVFPVQLMSDVVKSEDDYPVGIVTTCEDITERKASEEQIRRHLQHLTTLREIDMVILASLDLRVILNVLLNHLMNQLNIHAAAIMLLNPHTLMLEYAEGRGFRADSIRKTRMKLGEGLAGRVALERRLICIPDLRAERGSYTCQPFLDEEDLTVYFGLPLIAKGEVKGTLEIFHRELINPGTEWLDFLEALAGQAAIAIDNATMFNDLQRSNIELSLAYDTTLDGWSRALDLRDKETEGHSQRVTEITMNMARPMGIGEAELVHVRRGAMLHDIGKLGIPDRILHKPGGLSPEEWEIMKLHPVYAYEMLSPISFLKPALDIPYCHHEKWDGTGYPRGLRGVEIPAAARIFAVADIWDALCSVRPYRQAFDRKKAVDHVCSLERTHLDPEVLKVFLEIYG
ncbi:MAG: PAS domain S-box protein [Nitrospirae bacterium]|nr:PAS domain S-box protein [Nitrospirota bacterium]